jgi:hypothetical protein
MFEFECCRASSSQLVKWLNVWRLRAERSMRDQWNVRVRNVFTALYHRRAERQLHHDSMIEWLNGNSLDQPSWEARREKASEARRPRTVSQICNFICLPSMVIMRAPNSTPRTSRFAFDYFAVESYRWLNHVQVGNVCRWIAVIDTICRHLRTARRGKSSRSSWANKPVSPMMIYLKRYA